MIFAAYIAIWVGVEEGRGRERSNTKSEENALFTLQSRLGAASAQGDFRGHNDSLPAGPSSLGLLSKRFVYPGYVA